MKELKELIRQEYMKCANDPIYFIRNYCKITHPQKGEIGFNLYPHQEQLINQYLRGNVINLKARQLGLSTVTVGYALWKALYKQDQSIMFVTYKFDAAKTLLTKVRFMYDNLPNWMAVPLAVNNRLSMQFKNGSCINAVSSCRGDFGCSVAADLVILDEAGYIDSFAESWSTIRHMISPNGNVIVTSSATKKDTFFHELWKDSVKGLTNLSPTILPWYVHTEYDSEWRKHQGEIMGEEVASMECDCEFI